MSNAEVLKVTNLRKVYFGYTALDGISFAVKRGEIVGFLGPNGAGKSTTMRIVSTYQPATSGSVRVAGHDVFYAPREVQKSLGYMPEHNPLPLEMRVHEYLQFRFRLKGLRQRSRLDEVIDQCGLSKVQKRILGQLSKGYRQRVGLADALMHEPDLVILDEPTAGLDPNQIRSVRDLIKSLAPAMTVVLSTHILSEVSLTCDRVIILHQGSILTDEPTSTLQERFLQSADVVVEIDGPQDIVHEKLTALPQVAEVLVEAASPPYQRFTLRTQGAGDIRPQIFETVHQNNWTLCELHRREESLENIFNRLTVQSQAQ